MRSLLIRSLIPAAISVSNCSAFAQKLGQGTESGPSLWRVSLALALCLALAVGGALVMRSRMRTGRLTLPALGERRLSLIDRVRLPHQVDLCLVRCPDGDYLVITSPRDSHIGPRVGGSRPQEECADA